MEDICECKSSQLSEVSVCLSEVMADIGVTDQIVHLRRKVGVERAVMSNVFHKLGNHPQLVYNFGSQSEGKIFIYVKSSKQHLDSRHLNFASTCSSMLGYESAYTWIILLNTVITVSRKTSSM